MDFSQRVRKAREHAQLERADLAGRIKSHKNTIERLENRPGDTGSTLTVQIARECKVNPYWLATGEESMEIDDRSQLSEDAFLVALALDHMNEDLRDQYTGRVLATALNFVPTTHPAYKRMAALYRKAQKREAVRDELRGKSRNG